MGVWDWVVDVMTKLTENMKEYKAKWFQEHKDDPEFRAKRYEAVKRYQAQKMAEDPEGFTESMREYARRSQRKHYVKRSDMTEEELEESRRKTRERVAEYRRRKKAEKAAQEAAQKGEQ